MNEVRTYRPESPKDALDFVRGVIAAHPVPESLHIVEQLVEIAVSELKERLFDISATISPQSMTVKLHHGGEPLSERLVWRMGEHTDRVDYYPGGESDGWKLVIRRDIASQLRQ